MDITEYISTRLDVQIAWYEKKSVKAQRLYKRYQVIKIVLSASIPILSGYTSNTVIAVLVGTFGSVIAASEAIVKLNKYYEQWIDYRTTSELLKYHKYLYITNSSPYDAADEARDNLFIRSIESIMSSENNEWKIINIDHIKKMS